ncbi:MAG: EamA family transporter RarD, partial [Hyphomonadaceae bacterium]
MSSETRMGFFSAALAYTLWGFLPLYFRLLDGTDPITILAHRILWSVPTAVLLVAAARSGGEVRDVLQKPKRVGWLILSAVMIAANWAIYIWAVSQQRVLEASLGYFINPLISFLFASVFFSERFTPIQIGALVLATLGVLNQTLVVGEFPWVALSLAGAFALYGVIRKQVAVSSRVGFLIEAAALAPAALLYLAFWLPAGAPSFGVTSGGHLALLALAGPMTATPLILFAIGARRLRLSTIALLQFIAPSIQFAL